jgi:hypothetical protein
MNVSFIFDAATIDPVWSGVKQQCALLDDPTSPAYNRRNST